VAIYHKGINDYGLTLDGAVTNIQTTFTVNESPAAIDPLKPVYLAIESELVEVTAISGNDMTVVRGVAGTSASSHLDATALALHITAEQINELIDQKQDIDTLPVFGGNYETDSKVAVESSNANLPGVLYHSLVTGVLPAGGYILLSHSQMTVDNGTSFGFRRILLDAVEIFISQVETKDTNNDNDLSPHVPFTIGVGGLTHTIELYYGKISNAANANMLNNRFTLWRVT